MGECAISGDGDIYAKKNSCILFKLISNNKLCCIVLKTCEIIRKQAIVRLRSSMIDNNILLKL